MSKPRTLSSNDFEEAEKLFTCAVCLSTYTDPRFLPECGHTFCLGCLESLQQNETTTSKLKCPECRTQHKVSHQGNLAEDLLPNEAVAKGLADLCQSRVASKNSWDECPHQASSKQLNCSHCTLSFCEGCSLRHCEMLRLESAWHLAALGHHLQNASQSYASSSIIEPLGRLLDRSREAYNSFSESSIFYFCLDQCSTLHKELTLAQVKAAGALVALGSYDDELALQIIGSSNEAMLVKGPTLEEMLASASNEGDLETLRFIFELVGLEEDCRNFLLQRKMSTVSDAGLTCLHLSAQNGHLEAVKYLILELGADSHLKDNGPEVTPLHVACGSGHLEIAKFLIQMSPDLIEDEATNSSTPLCFACLDGNIELVRFLVTNCKAVVEKPNRFSFSPLHCAVSEDHLEVVKFLIEEAHADVKQIDADGRNLLEIAMRNHHVEIVRYLLERNPNLMHVFEDTHHGYDLIHVAAQYSLPVLKFLIEEWNVDQEILNKSGFPPLWFAARHGSVENVRYLLEKGVDPLKPSQNVLKELAIHPASKEGHLEVVEILLETCPDLLNAKDGAGRNALFLAMENEHYDMAKFLLAQGASLDTSRDDQQSPDVSSSANLTSDGSN